MLLGRDFNDCACLTVPLIDKGFYRFYYLLNSSSVTFESYKLVRGILRGKSVSD